jgi:hypothetical protein
MKKFKKIILLVLLIDVSLILLHLFFSQNNYFFNLDIERNLPAVYSGLKLISIGVLALFIYFKLIKKFWPWLFLGLMFIGGGLDEILEIHETVGNYFARQGLTDLDWYSNQVFYWTLVFSPLIIGAVVFLIYFIKHFLFQENKTRWFFIIGLVCFIFVFFLEVAGGFLTHLTELYQKIIVFEEIFEIFGATMFLIGTLGCLENFQSEKLFLKK